MPENIHILHIETGRHLYGGALQVLYLAKGLAEAGCRNTIVCPRGSDIANSDVPATQVYTVPVKGDLDALFMLRLRRIISTVRPDLVHVHSRRGADIWSAVAAWCTNTPAIITRRVDNPESPAIARLKYRSYRRVVAISEGIRRLLISEGVPPRKIECIPSAVDAERFIAPCDRHWFLREFELRPTQRTIGMIAQFIRRKGHRFLIAAAPMIMARCPEARFLLFGKGPLEEEIRRQCSRIGIADQVIFAGFRHDLARILPCLDVVVHPATLEGLGVSLLQAAAAGVPIVASRVGGIPEVVMDGFSGILIDPEDTGELVNSVTRLLSEPELARLLGERGRRIAIEDFSIDAMVKRYLYLYRDLSS